MPAIFPKKSNYGPHIAFENHQKRNFDFYTPDLEPERRPQRHDSFSKTESQTPKTIRFPTSDVMRPFEESFKSYRSTLIKSPAKFIQKNSRE